MTPNHYQPDELDFRILGLISNNARISFLEVARMCNVSGAAVHQRIQRLMNNDIITGSSFAINAPRLGYDTCAFIGLYFTQGTDIHYAAQEIEKINEVTECHHTTGAYDLLVKIYAHNNAHLHHIIQTKFKPLGTTRSETIISYKESFCRQLNLDPSSQK